MKVDITVGLAIHNMVRDHRLGHQDTIADVLREVEGMGYWGTFAGHHITESGNHVGWADPDIMDWRFPDPLVLLSYMAAVTRTMKICTYCINLGYVQPIPLAHALASIDSLSGGRLVFTAAPGTREKEFTDLGVDMRQRGRMANEYLEIITLLWTSPKASYSGKYFSFKDVSLVVPPVQKPRPPIWIAGQSEASLQRAIKYADAWAPSSPAAASAPARPVAAAATCPGTSPNIGPLTPKLLKETLARANQQRKELGKPPLGIALNTNPPMRFLPSTAARPRKTRVEATTISGEPLSPEEHMEALAAFVEAGANNIVLKLDGSTTKEILDT